MERVLLNIAKRLQALAVYRDWQQCWASTKISNMNTEQLNMLTTLETVLKL